ncbi:hypothetical protein STEG23_035260 [Scotinomys teguina]
MERKEKNTEPKELQSEQRLKGSDLQYQCVQEYFQLSLLLGLGYLDLCFNLVNLSIGWNLPSSAFCKVGFVDRFLGHFVYDLFGFGVFLDCRVYFLYCILYIGDSVFHLLYSVGYACICIS